MSFRWQQGRFSTNLSRRGAGGYRLRCLLPVLSALVLACGLLVATQQPVAACLAYSNRTQWEYRSLPALVVTAIVIEVRGARHFARVESIFHGRIRSPFVIRDDDGCHLPDLPPGQRVLLMSASRNQGNRYPATDGEFTNFSGPIWLLDDEGTVTREPGLYDGLWRGPSVNGVQPRTLDHALRAIGVSPDTRMPPPTTDPATALGMILLVASGATAIALVGRKMARYA